VKRPHILLATDLSDEAQRAFGPVSQLADAIDACISLVHVVYVVAAAGQGATLGGPVGLPNYDVDREAAERALAKKAQALAPERHAANLVVSGGSVARSIVEVAQKEQADLIALATHGRTGFRRLVLGSVAEEVVRRSAVPVLCYPRLAKEPAGTRHIVIATDLEQGAQAFGPVAELARRLGARVTLVHVVSEPYARPSDTPLTPPMVRPETSGHERARAAIQLRFAPLVEGLTWEPHVVTHADPARGVLAAAEALGADVIALATGGRSGVSRLALGSVAETVLRHSFVPVLTVRRGPELGIFLYPLEPTPRCTPTRFHDA